MSAWSLSIRDPSGKHGCLDCSKQEMCISREMLETTYYHLVEQSEDDELHPEKVGWGPIDVRCYGFIQKTAVVI